MGEQPWMGKERGHWLAEVEAWLASVAADGDLGSLVSLQPVKERVWGAVLRVTATRGTAWFKASGPLCRHESRVIEALSARWPRLVPELLAVDHERAWMLLADHGHPMGDVLSASDQVAVVLRLLPEYADMQRRTVDLIPAWTGAGMPDRRPERLPNLLAELVDGRSPIGPLALTPDERSALAGGADTFDRVCQELAEAPIPAGIDHADLHGGNVFVDGPDARLADWGDSCVTHPHCTLAVPYAFVAAALPAGEQRQATLRLRDAYLEGWGGDVDHRRTFGLAVWTAHVTRAVSVAHESEGTRADQREVIDLLRAWQAKASLLDQPDELIQP